MAVFAILSTYAWLCLSGFSYYIKSTGFVAILVASTISSSPLLDRLVYRKWVYDDRQAIVRTAPPKGAEIVADGEDKFSSRFAFGEEVAETVRGPGTSWQAKGIPHFSSADPQWIPSPFVLIVWKLSIILMYLSQRLLVRYKDGLRPRPDAAITRTILHQKPRGYSR